MKKTADYNNLSDEFMKKIPKLRRGQKVTFELLGIKDDPDNPGIKKIPFSRKVPSTDRIYDAGDKTYKDIALIEGVGVGGKPTFRSVHFLASKGGKISLIGGRAADDEIWEYFMSCNYRDGNKSRDNSKRLIFRLIDPVSDAKAEREARKKIKVATDIAFELKDDELKILATAAGRKEDEDTDVLRNYFEKMAEKDADRFMHLYTDKGLEYKSVIQRCLSKGFITFNQAQNKYAWKDGEVIAVVPRSSVRSSVDSLFEFLVKDKKGQAVYKELKNLLNGKKENEADEKPKKGKGNKKEDDDEDPFADILDTPKTNKGK